VAAFENNLGEDLRITANAFINLANIIKGSEIQRESVGVETGYYSGT
jgi:hypothetical protein